MRPGRMTLQRSMTCRVVHVSSVPSGVLIDFVSWIWISDFGSNKKEKTLRVCEGKIVLGNETLLSPHYHLINMGHKLQVQGFRCQARLGWSKSRFSEVLRIRKKVLRIKFNSEHFWIFRI